jgi:hypothetical protein
MKEDPKSPVALAIGHAVMEWNDMCEDLGMLFGVLLHPSEPWSKRGLAIWHSSNNDRGQRDMLIAAANAVPDAMKKANPKLVEDICWLCQRANSLADRRNDLVHAPLTMQIDPADSSKAVGVVPASFFGHPRALKLEGKDLVAEFGAYAAYATKLKMFTRNIMASIQFGENFHAWPDRPQLPDLRVRNNHQHPPRQQN